jgi:hypothetical protein
LVEKKGKKGGGRWVTELAGVVDDGVIANYSHAAGRWHGAAKPQAFSDQLLDESGQRSFGFDGVGGDPLVKRGKCSG